VDSRDLWFSFARGAPLPELALAYRGGIDPGNWWRDDVLDGSSLRLTAVPRPRCPDMDQCRSCSVI
jgi:hypothetical protein